MRLYHFTSKIHLRAIMGCAYLDTTESNIGSMNPRHKPKGEHAAPDVLWCTDQDGTEKSLVTYSLGLALNHPRTVDRDFKMDVRITLDVPDEDVVTWADWAERHGIHPDWRAFLEQTPRRPHWWFVVPRRVPISEWREIGLGRGEWKPVFDEAALADVARQVAEQDAEVAGA